MTSTIDNLKRKGGDQLSDWKAPRTTEASKPIIHIVLVVLTF